jgi:hypothetical protein
VINYQMGLARRADWSRRRNPPSLIFEEAGYGFAYNPPCALTNFSPEGWITHGDRCFKRWHASA